SLPYPSIVPERVSQRPARSLVGLARSHATNSRVSDVQPSVGPAANGFLDARPRVHPNREMTRLCHFLARLHARPTSTARLPITAGSADHRAGLPIAGPGQPGAAPVAAGYGPSSQA